MHVTPLIPVVTAAEARTLDAQTISGLPDSFTLMHRAASAAVRCIDARDYERRVAVFTGPGNNGGDGWVMAGLLRDAGWDVRVHVAAEPRTADAQRARREAEQGGPFAAPTGDEPVAIDALLGTGATGQPRGAIAGALNALRTHPGHIVAIDLPSALDASTGEDCGAVAARTTLTFGSVKRGQLLRRDLVGELVVLDIGLVHADADTPRMAAATLAADVLPRWTHDTYKGTRGRVGIVGGDAGMAGAAILAAQGAHASGAGMVRADVDAASAPALQIAVPYATVGTWQHHTPACTDPAWPDALVIGPGLDGTRAEMRRAITRLLHAYDGPVVLDAGALTAFAHRASTDLHAGDDAHDADDDALQQLRYALRGRPALLTPHVGEFTRLFAPGTAPTDRFEAPRTLARLLHATVLLKGVPTVIASPAGEVLVSAAGNAALALGGSGDLLSGIAGALLAQRTAPLHAGATAALVHGGAATYATFRNSGTMRGVTMSSIIDAIPSAWHSMLSDDRTSFWDLRGVPVMAQLSALPTR